MASEILKTDFTFVWRIENYSMCPHRMGEYIQSQIFTAECLSASRWHLIIYPRGNRQVNRMWISCFLYRNEDDSIVEHRIVDFSIHILKPNNEIFCSSEDIVEHHLKRSDNYGFPRLIEVDVLNKEMEKWSEDTLKICCCIKSEKPKTWCEAKATVDCNRCFCAWDVTNPNTTDWTDIKKFKLLENYSLIMTLTAPENDILIHISDSDIQFLKCKIILVNIDGAKQCSKTASHLFANIDDVWEFPTFITKTYFNDKRDILMRDGIFTLKVEFYFPNGSESKETLVYTHSNLEKYSKKTDYFQGLRDDLKELLLSNRHTDVQFQVGNQIMEAHKCILSVRSPVFSAMFNQEMIENKTGVVEISDIDSETLSSFLQFVYTGTIASMDYERAMKLLTVAHKYQVSSLEENCSNFLMSVMSVENTYDVLVIADMIGHKLLKKSALDFIKSNASEILSSSTWSQYIEKNPKLGFEILNKLWDDLRNEVDKKEVSFRK